MKYTKINIETSKPKQRASMADKHYCLNNNTIAKMVNSEDFWLYFFDKTKLNIPYEQIVVRYHDDYYKRRKVYLE